jgi:bacterioferritin-associated ferredoxin
MMVCLCHGVSERRVRREIEHGATTIDELAASCGAGACCCGCHPTLDALLEEHVVRVTVPSRRLRLA